MASATVKPSIFTPPLLLPNGLLSISGLLVSAREPAVLIHGAKKEVGDKKRSRTKRIVADEKKKTRVKKKKNSRMKKKVVDKKKNSDEKKNSRGWKKKSMSLPGHRS